MGATSANPAFRSGVARGAGRGNAGTMGSALGAISAHGQFGNRVMPMQFVRHGSPERGSLAIPRRQRSRDRSPTRNRTLSPAQAAALRERSDPADRMEA